MSQMYLLRNISLLFFGIFAFELCGGAPKQNGTGRLSGGRAQEPCCGSTSNSHAPKTLQNPSGEKYHRSALGLCNWVIPYSEAPAQPLHQTNSLCAMSDKIMIFLGYLFPITAAAYILCPLAIFSLFMAGRRRNSWQIYRWHVEKFASLSVTAGIRGNRETLAKCQRGISWVCASGNSIQIQIDWCSHCCIENRLGSCNSNLI